MTLPRIAAPKLTVALSLCLLVAGCSSMPFSKKNKATDSGPTMSEAAYYQQALRNMERNQFDDSTQALEALDTYYPSGAFTEQAQLDLMYSHFRQGDMPGAVSIAERFIKRYPANAQLDYAYYVRGVATMEQAYDGLMRYTSLQQSHRDTTFLRAAYAAFQDFLKRFTGSRYSADVQQRMIYLQQQLAESEINIARYNTERKAYVAAAQRARWVLEYYPLSPQVPEALATLAYSYQQLNRPELAEPYLKLIQLNYPQLLKDGRVNLHAAQAQRSLVNRLTLGLAGERTRLQPLPPADTSQTQPQTIQNNLAGTVQTRPASAGPAPSALSLPPELSSSLMFSLPDNGGDAHSSDMPDLPNLQDAMP